MNINQKSQPMKPKGSKSAPEQRLDEAAAKFQSVFGPPPALAIVLGSGFGQGPQSCAQWETGDSLGFHELPAMVPPSVEGHAGSWRLARIKDVPVLYQKGRVHFYEGHSPEQVVFSVRAMARWGIKRFLLTNAAGAVNPSFRPGQLMIIEDQINLTGTSPLIGPHESSLGPRFPDMTELYSAQGRAVLQRSADRTGVVLRQGVYAGLTGPAYETAAEIRYLRAIGADAVGMSTVMEAQALRHMGATVVGVSCITNLGTGLSSQKLNHQEVVDFAASAAENFSKLLFHSVNDLVLI